MSDEAVKIEAAVPEVVAPVESTTEATTSAPDATMAEPEKDAVKAEDTELKVEATKEPGDAKTDDTKDATMTDDKTASEEAVSEKTSNMLKTTTKMREDEHKKSYKKFDPSINGITDDPSKIRAQVDFYFGDSNLPTDKFLWRLTGGPENKPVDLKQICNFSRMRRFQPYEAVVKALKESKFMQITGEEGEEMVSRKIAYKEGKQNALKFASSVYVKGFGDEEPSTQFDCEAFFTKFGTVNAVRLRRTSPGQLFKGSVFVEFSTPEEAQAFLALDPAPKWKGHDLKIMSKKAYVEEKDQLIKDGKLEPSESNKPQFYEGRGSNRSRGDRGGRGRGGRGGFNKNRDQDDWKNRREEDRKGGFKDRNNHRGGRGGRGRGGRGGRGGRRDSRDNDRRNDKEGNKQEDKAADSAAPKAEATESAPKRAREDDGGSDERPAKKADTKAETAAEA